jgi:hypothetical protein
MVDPFFEVCLVSTYVIEFRLSVQKRENAYGCITYEKEIIEEKM